MTFSDTQFLKAIGIDPCSLGAPSPSPHTPPPPAEAPVPKLAEEDSRWLHDLRVAWEHEPEPEFIVPKTLPEYLGRYPTGIREAVGVVAKELGLALLDSGLDDLAREVKEMFIGFDEEGLEDVIAMFPFDTAFRPRAGEHGSAKFQRYVQFRVRACVPVVLENRMNDSDNLGKSR
jgi:hypothetical protein